MKNRSGCSPTHELRCLAQHPRSIRRGEREGHENRHQVLIQPFPLACRPVVDRDGRPRVVARWEQVHGSAISASPNGQIQVVLDGDKVRFGVRCPNQDCLKITVYEVVAFPILRRRPQRDERGAA